MEDGTENNNIQMLPAYRTERELKVNALGILSSTSLSLKDPRAVCPIIARGDGTVTNLGRGGVSVHAKASAERP